MKRMSPLSIIALLALFFVLGLLVDSHHAGTTAKASTSANTSIGPKVVTSSFGSIKVSYVTSKSFGIEPGEQVGGFATCPSGQIAVGGGGYGSSANPLRTWMRQSRARVQEARFRTSGPRSSTTAQVRRIPSSCTRSASHQRTPRSHRRSSSTEHTERANRRALPALRSLLLLCVSPPRGHIYRLPGWSTAMYGSL